jgi:large subunit ribosomal protein L35
MKTHKGAQRRFKITGSGKVIQAKEGRGNKLNRSKRVRNLYSKGVKLSKTNEGKIKVALPYGLP